jgi:hypothetical protein
MYKRRNDKLLAEMDPTFLKAMKKADLFLWSLPFLFLGPLVVAWIIR